MADTVELLIEDPRWQDTALETLAPKAFNLALRAAGIATRNMEVSVLACDDGAISALNSTFRGKSSATNVLSWPALDLFPDMPGGAPSTAIPPDPFRATSLGDIAIAYETVMEEAQSADIPADDHILHLILHASLHLLGYDHIDEADANRMEQLEVEVLATQGIASPYEA